MSGRIDVYDGGMCDVSSGWRDGSLALSVRDKWRDLAVVHLTPDEARGLAQRLLKEAAEVEFAARCNAATEGVEP